MCPEFLQRSFRNVGDQTRLFWYSIRRGYLNPLKKKYNTASSNDRTISSNCTVFSKNELENWWASRSASSNSLLTDIRNGAESSQEFFLGGYRRTRLRYIYAASIARHNWWCSAYVGHLVRKRYRSLSANGLLGSLIRNYRWILVLEVLFWIPNHRRTVTVEIAQVHVPISVALNSVSVRIYSVWIYSISIFQHFFGVSCST